MSSIETVTRAAASGSAQMMESANYHNEYAINELKKGNTAAAQEWLYKAQLDAGSNQYLQKIAGAETSLVKDAARNYQA